MRASRRARAGVHEGAERHPLSVVYGGGGPFGIAYGAGVAHGLAAAGIPVAEAPALGTSAGSWVASIVALGLSYEDLADVETPRVPARQPGLLAGIARSVFGDARHPLVSASAFRIKGPKKGRTILRGSDHDLADICAASSAAPGLLPRHVVDGHTYLDGGVRSITSVGHAAPGDHVIVVAPIARGVMGRGGAFVQRQLDRERRAWVGRNPEGRITVITPTPEIGRMAGRTAKELFDGDRARAVYPLARAQGEQWGERLQQAAAAST